MAEELDDFRRALRPEALEYLRTCYNDDINANLLLDYANHFVDGDDPDRLVQPTTAAEWMHAYGLSQKEAARYAAEIIDSGRWLSDSPYNHFKHWVNVYGYQHHDPCDLPAGSDKADKHGSFVWICDRWEKSEKAIPCRLLRRLNDPDLATAFIERKNNDNGGAAAVVPKAQPTAEYWFHCTSRVDAINTATYRIEACMSDGGQDFNANGAGWYLYRDIHSALEQVAKFGPQAAVLVYQFKLGDLPKHTTEDDSERERKLTGLVFADADESWQAMVGRQRRDDQTRADRDWDWVYGPQCSNPSDVVLKNAVPQSSGRFQLCIRSNDVAEEVDNWLHSILFFDITKRKRRE
jgi:hypothetical protein